MSVIAVVNANGAAVSSGDDGLSITGLGAVSWEHVAALDGAGALTWVSSDAHDWFSHREVADPDFLGPPLTEDSQANTTDTVGEPQTDDATRVAENPAPEGLGQATPARPGERVMGLSGPSYRPIERTLITQQTQLFTVMGLSTNDAKEKAETSVQAAIKSAKESGRYGREPLGETMLAQPSGFWRTYLDEIRSLDGVTDEDIRFWWDLDEVERALVDFNDQAMRVSVYIQATGEAIDRGLPYELAKVEGASKVRETLPAWGLPTQMNGPDGARLLPFELERRLTRWMEVYAYPVQPPHSPSEGFAVFNDWVREMVSKGAL